MNTGTIARIVSDRGFGFITMAGAAKDIFFHATTVNGNFDDLKDGDAVSFDLEDGDKGQSAVNVTKA
jgi:CspA family cold shock protein